MEDDDVTEKEPCGDPKVALDFVGELIPTMFAAFQETMQVCGQFLCVDRWLSRHVLETVMLTHVVDSFFYSRL